MDTLRQHTAKQYRKIRRILKNMGYLKPKIKPLTERQRVKLEGRS